MTRSRRPVGPRDHITQRHGPVDRARSSPFAPSPAPAAGEVTQGLRACLALFSQRRDDILHVVHTRAVGGQIVEIARWAAAQRVPCIEMIESEVDRFADSNQNEGLCLLARPRKWASMQSLLDLLSQSRGLAIALDRVRNPYNIGAILRSAAFFGLDAMLLGAPAPHPGLSPGAVRVAEGGAEHVRLARTTDLADTLARLRRGGVHVIGADANANAEAQIVARPAMLVVGNEREGLADRVRAQCDALVAVRGSGRIESLNVAVAAGVLLAIISGAPSRALQPVKP